MYAHSEPTHIHGTAQARIRSIAESEANAILDFARERPLPQGWTYQLSSSSVFFRPLRSMMPCIKVDRQLRVTVDTGRGCNVKSVVHKPKNKAALGVLLDSLLATHGTI